MEQLTNIRIELFQLREGLYGNFDSLPSLIKNGTLEEKIAALRHAGHTAERLRFLQRANSVVLSGIDADLTIRGYPD